MHAQATADPGPQDQVRSRVLTLVASVYDVRVDDLVHPSRGSPDAAAARQVAIYLSHTVLAMNFADLGDAFGRTPSTVLHAVRKVEELREDPQIDQTLDWLQSILRAAKETGR